MATVPVSATVIRFLSNIPFANDYKNSRWFDSKSQQTSYFMGKPIVHSMTEVTYQRIEGRTFVACNKSIDDLWSTNYMMFQNSQYSNKWFYAFVTKLEYVQKNRTNVHFQIDVLQTWMFDMKFKPSFVIREHRKLWNSDGTPVINTIDEGLNYGTDYDTVATYQFVPNGGFKWLVIVSKNPLHGDSKDVEPTVIGTPQPLSYYIVPFKDDDKTPLIILKNGNDFPITPPTNLLKDIYKDEKAVNNIVSIYVTDYTGIPVVHDPAPMPGHPELISFPNNSNEIRGATIGDSSAVLYVQKVVKFSPMHKEIFPDKYSNFGNVKESKLLMYPYCVIVADDFKGNRTVYKPEYVNSKNFYVNMKGSLGTSNKTSINVPDYNHSVNDGQKGETSNESALINSNPSDVPVLNDYLAAFLQGNRNSIENQKNSVMWNGIMGALGGSIGGVASATTGNAIGVASSATGIATGAGNTVLQLQAIEAKQQDISNIPPQIVKMGSNTSYDYGNNYNGVFFMKKQIKPEYRKILSDFFNMFGYKTNEVKVPNFHTRRYWNFIQTSSCVITGNLNNEDLQELKNIFDSGVTLWHTDDVGNYDLNNEVIS